MDRQNIIRLRVPNPVREEIRRSPCLPSHSRSFALGPFLSCLLPPSLLPPYLHTKPPPPLPSFFSSVCLCSASLEHFIFSFHSPTHSFIHSFIYSFIHSLLTHPFAHYQFAILFRQGSTLFYRSLLSSPASFVIARYYLISFLPFVFLLRHH